MYDNTCKQLSLKIFFRLFNMDLSSDIGARSSSESSMVSSTFGESTTADFNDDTEYLIRADQKPATRYFFDCRNILFFHNFNFLCLF